MRRDCRVLIAVDEPTICELLRDTLLARGVAVHSATNSRQALETLQAQAIDLMFIDLWLVDGSGLDLLRVTRQRWPQLTSVVVTGHGTLETAVEAMRLGACDYITNPMERQAVVDALDRVLEEKRPNACASVPASTEAHRAGLPRIKIIADSPQMRSVLSAAELAAESDTPVLIEGESGVGKQILARWIDQRHAEPRGPFIHFAGASLKDARPGAEHPDWQRFIVGEASSGAESGVVTGRCTFYVEHVEELPMWAQRQLLHRIDWTWLSNNEPIDRNAARLHLIVSSEIDLRTAVGSGTFARGLYDDLSLAAFSIPPLCQRPEDVRALVHHFLEQFCREQQRDPGPYRRAIGEKTWQALLRYSWPGNVRELISLIGRALLSRDCHSFERILSDHVSEPAPALSADMVSVPMAGDLRTIERSLIREVVRRCGGNKAAAARALGMHRRTLYRFLQPN